MYVTREMVEQMAERYGHPVSAAFAAPVGENEFSFIRSTQKHRRRHDVTMYIHKDGRIVVIAKHHYPPELYRAPSGGLNPGESFAEGIAREAMEETGATIALERFLLQAEVEFTGPAGRIPWTSYVFQARYLAGDFAFTDTREIREARLARLEEFAIFGRIMRSTDVGGLHYRAALHEAVEPLLTVADGRETEGGGLT